MHTVDVNKKRVEVKLQIDMIYRTNSPPNTVEIQSELNIIWDSVTLRPHSRNETLEINIIVTVANI